jgi:hypothetical protein
MRDTIRAAAELLADLPPRLVGLGVLLAIAVTVWAVAFF